MPYPTDASGVLGGADMFLDSTRSLETDQFDLFDVAAPAQHFSTPGPSTFAAKNLVSGPKPARLGFSGVRTQNQNRKHNKGFAKGSVYDSYFTVLLFLLLLLQQFCTAAANFCEKDKQSLTFQLHMIYTSVQDSVEALEAQLTFPSGSCAAGIYTKDCKMFEGFDT